MLQSEGLWNCITVTFFSSSYLISNKTEYLNWRQTLYFSLFLIFCPQYHYEDDVKIKSLFGGWGFSSVVERLPSKPKALGLVLSSEKKKKKRVESWGWRDGSVVKHTDCFSKGPEFNSQQPHGGSQPSVMGSDALFWCVIEDSFSVLI